MAIQNTSDRWKGVFSSLAIKAPCDAVSIVNLTMSGSQTVNGVAVVGGDRVLVAAQTDPIENGIYDVDSASDWTRSADWDGNRDVVDGTLTTVKDVVGRHPFYQANAVNPVVVGTSAVTFILADGPNVDYPQTQAEITAVITPSQTAYIPGDVRRYGAIGDGATDAASAFTDAATLMNTANGHNMFVPPERFMLDSQVSITAPADRRCEISAYGAEILNSTAVISFIVTGGSTTGGLTVKGLKINHTGNTTALGGFDCHGAWNLRFQDCAVEVAGAAAAAASGYSCWTWRQTDDADVATACYFGLMDACFIRPAAGGNLIPIGVTIEGACNNFQIRGGVIQAMTTGVLRTIPPGQTYLANALLITGVSFEAYTTAFHSLGAITSNTAGDRFIGNRFENGTTMFSYTVTTTQPSQPPFSMGNMIVSNAGTYLNNPESLYFSSMDLSVTPDGLFSIIQDKDITFRSLTADFKVMSAGTSGLELVNTSDASLARLSVHTGGGALLSATSGLWQTGVKAISATATESKNLRGTVTFATAATAAVTFGTAEPDATYFLVFSGDTAETYSWSAKATGGFTITSSNASSTAVVDWILLR